MRKRILTLAMALAFGLLSAWPVVAEESCTEAMTGKNWTMGRRATVKKLVFSWTTAANGSFTECESTDTLNGWILGVETNPGATAPTDNYGVTLTSADGTDLLGGAGLSRDTANTEYTRPYVNSVYAEVPYQGKLNLDILSNSVDSATGTVIIYFTGEYR